MADLERLGETRKVTSTVTKSKRVIHSTTWSRDGKVILKSSTTDRGEKGILTMDSYWADAKLVYVVIRDGASVNRVMSGSDGITISEVESSLSSEVGLLITSRLTGFVECFWGEGFRIPDSDSELALKKDQNRALSEFTDALNTGDSAKMEKSFGALEKIKDKAEDMIQKSEPDKAPEPTARSGRGSP